MRRRQRYAQASNVVTVDPIIEEAILKVVEKVEEVRDDKMKVCPHCARLFRWQGLATHVKACKKKVE